MDGLRLREIGNAPDGYLAVQFFHHRVFEVYFGRQHGHGRQEIAVGNHVPTFFLTTDAHKFFDVAVPGRDVFIAQRPIDADTFFGVGFKIMLTPAVGLATPVHGFTPGMVSTNPVERPFFDEGVLLVVGEKGASFLVGKGAETVIRPVFFRRVDRHFAAVFKIPGIFVGGVVIYRVFDFPAALQHEYFHAFLGELFGGDASGHARTYDDCVETVGFFRIYVEFLHCDQIGGLIHDGLLPGLKFGQFKLARVGRILKRSFCTPLRGVVPQQGQFFH